MPSAEKSIQVDQSPIYLEKLESVCEETIMLK